jgi:hypothetical protein
LVRSLVEGAVGAMLVVMTNVDREDTFELPSVHDQDSVEAVGCKNSVRPQNSTFPELRPKVLLLHALAIT